MKRFVQGQERSQGTLFPACLDEYVSDDNPVRVIDVFVEERDLRALQFERVIPQGTGRGPAQDLHLRLSQPHPVQPPPRAGDRPQP